MKAVCWLFCSFHFFPCEKKTLLLMLNFNNYFLRWLERVLVFFDALYLGVKIIRLKLANHDHILLQNNDNIKVSIFGRFLKKFVAMATQLGFEV